MADVKQVVISDSTPVDIKEYQDKYVYILDVPGARLDKDIYVQIELPNVLTIRANRTVNEEIGVVKYIQMQRKIKNVNCKFELPFDANPHAVSARVFSSVLVVTIKKFVLEKNKPEVVAVKAEYSGKFS